MPSVAVAPVKFRSDNRSLRVVRRPAGERFGADNKLHIVQPEVTYEFDGGWLWVNPGQDVIADGEYDVTTGEFAEQDAVSWLRAKALATAGAAHGGFSEVLPVAPSVESVIVQIVEAQLAGDVEMVLAIGNEERAMWNRPEVMQRATAALEALELTIDEPPKK